jgi:hypothetical protein
LSSDAEDNDGAPEVVDVDVVVVVVVVVVVDVVVGDRN